MITYGVGERTGAADVMFFLSPNLLKHFLPSASSLMSWHSLAAASLTGKVGLVCGGAWARAAF